MIKCLLVTKRQHFYVQQVKLQTENLLSAACMAYSLKGKSSGYHLLKRLLWLFAALLDKNVSRGSSAALENLPRYQLERNLSSRNLERVYFEYAWGAIKGYVAIVIETIVVFNVIRNLWVEEQGPPCHKGGVEIRRTRDQQHISLSGLEGRERSSRLEMKNLGQQDDVSPR